MTFSRGLGSPSPTPSRSSSPARQRGFPASARRGKRAKHLHEKYLEGSVAVGLFATPNHIWAIVSPAFARGLCCREEDLWGKPICDILPRSANEKFFRSLDEVYRTGIPFYDREVKLMALAGPNGKAATRWIFSCLPVQNREGKIRGLCLYGREITGAGAKKAPRTRELERQVDERTAEWQWAKRQLRNIPVLIQQARDDERLQVSHELHDATGQLLAALCLNLRQACESCSNPSTVEKLRQGLELLDEMSEELHAIARSSRPSLIEQGGLSRAIAQLVQIFSARSGIEVQTEIADLSGLSPDQETAIFRVVQEALTNVQRHSQSPTAAVRITRSPTEIRIEVRDQGRGFPAQVQARATSGLGIEGMRERLRVLGGSLEVHSSPSGTLLCAILPLLHCAKLRL